MKDFPSSLYEPEMPIDIEGCEIWANGSDHIIETLETLKKWLLNASFGRADENEYDYEDIAEIVGEAIMHLRQDLTDALWLVSEVKRLQAQVSGSKL